MSIPHTSTPARQLGRRHARPTGLAPKLRAGVALSSSIPTRGVRDGGDCTMLICRITAQDGNLYICVECTFLSCTRRAADYLRVGLLQCKS